MKNAKILTFVLPFLCAGCLTQPPSSYDPTYDPYYQPMRTKTQVQQSHVKVKQKQKVIQNTNTQNVQVYQNSRHYPGNAQGFAPAYGQRYYNRDAHAYNQQVYRQVQNQQQAQQAAVDYPQQQRQQQQALEEQQIEQAKQASLQTYAEETARRQQNLAAEEARQIEQAKQESLRTYAEEEARRQENVAPVNVPQPALQEPVQPDIVATPLQDVGQKSWKPSEGQLVQAGELVMDLKKSKGGANPSHDEMSNQIQSNMGLSEDQAQKVIRKLAV